jgi:hypothetical protein
LKIERGSDKRAIAALGEMRRLHGFFNIAHRVPVSSMEGIGASEVFPIAITAS